MDGFFLPVVLLAKKSTHKMSRDLVSAFLPCRATTAFVQRDTDVEHLKTLELRNVVCHTSVRPHPTHHKKHNYAREALECLEASPAAENYYDFLMIAPSVDDAGKFLRFLAPRGVLCLIFETSYNFSSHDSRLAILPTWILSDDTRHRTRHRYVVPVYRAE